MHGERRVILQRQFLQPWNHHVYQHAAGFGGYLSCLLGRQRMHRGWFGRRRHGHVAMRGDDVQRRQSWQLLLAASRWWVYSALQCDRHSRESFWSGFGSLLRDQPGFDNLRSSPGLCWLKDLLRFHRMWLLTRQQWNLYRRRNGRFVSSCRKSCGHALYNTVWFERKLPFSAAWRHLHHDQSLLLPLRT